MLPTVKTAFSVLKMQSTEHIFSCLVKSSAFCLPLIYLRFILMLAFEYYTQYVTVNWALFLYFLKVGRYLNRILILRSPRKTCPAIVLVRYAQIKKRRLRVMQETGVTRAQSLFL